jgi:CMP-N-acetylneuraminic acid synthetase
MILGITPARGGSKGLPGKNIAVVNGKPLIAYAIDIGLTAPSIDHYIVSTDSQKISDIAKSYGADVPFLRPPSLATDTTPMLPVLHHAVLESEAHYQTRFDTIVLLDPTAPLREIKDVEECLNLYHKEECNAVISVNEAKKNPFFNMVQLIDGYCSLVNTTDPPITRRQDAPEVYEMNTVVAVFSRSSVVNSDERIPNKTKLFLVPRHRSIDIDSLEDLKLFEHSIMN